MTTDPLDRLIRTVAPPVTVSDQRLEAVIEATFRRLDSAPLSSSLWTRIVRQGTLFWHYALSMGTASALGFLVGASLPAASGTTLLSKGTLIVSFSSALAGF